MILCDQCTRLAGAPMRNDVPIHLHESDTQALRADGARLIAPFAVAGATFGVTFGVLARDAGLGSVQAVVFSATTFAGSAQFAAASVLSAGGTLAAAIAAGGRVIEDSNAPGSWILADRSGNKVCIAAWPDGAPTPDWPSDGAPVAPPQE